MQRFIHMLNFLCYTKPISIKRLLSVRKLSMWRILCKNYNKLWPILTIPPQELCLHQAWRLSCGFKPGSKRHEVGPPHRTQSPDSGTKQHCLIPAWDLPQTWHKVEKQEEEEEQRLIPNPWVRPLQGTPLPATSPWDFLLWQQKSRNPGYFRIFPMGWALSWYTRVVVLPWCAKEKCQLLNNQHLPQWVRSD